MLFGSGPTALSAQEQITAKAIIIGSDRGGKIRAKLAELNRIRANGQLVELRGRVCYSTCTLYLGLPDVCVSPATRFGFHGPSRSGLPLQPDAFEYWSHLIAAHYPAPLRNWYLESGRNRINSYFRISGAELIRLGLPQCAARPAGS